MKFGYFDDENREYVITRPDTARSWSNYLGDTHFGSIISINAGGYSFYRSGGMGRFIRMRFNAIPMDQPGRYIYFRDMESGDYWSASWQPTSKPLAQYRSECCHGMGNTRILSEYSAVVSETNWFVPHGKAQEVWNALDDMLNIQYVQYTDTLKVHGNIIDHGTNIHIPEMPDDFAEKDQGRHSFQAMVGLKITGFYTDREAFLGPYRTYAWSRTASFIYSGIDRDGLGYRDSVQDLPGVSPACCSTVSLSMAILWPGICSRTRTILK